MDCKNTNLCSVVNGCDVADQLYHARQVQYENTPPHLEAIAGAAESNESNNTISAIQNKKSQYRIQKLIIRLMVIHS